MKRYLVAGIVLALGIAEGTAWGEGFTRVEATAPQVLQVNQRGVLSVRFLGDNGTVLAAQSSIPVKILDADGVVDGPSELMFEAGQRVLQIPLRAATPGAWMVEVVVEGQVPVWVPVTVVAADVARPAEAHLYRSATQPDGVEAELPELILEEMLEETREDEAADQDEGVHGRGAAGAGSSGLLVPGPLGLLLRVRLQAEQADSSAGAEATDKALVRSPADASASAVEASECGSLDSCVVLTKGRDVRPLPDGTYQVQFRATWYEGNSPAPRLTPLPLEVHTDPPMSGSSLEPARPVIEAGKFSTEIELRVQGARRQKTAVEVFWGDAHGSGTAATRFRFLGPDPVEFRLDLPQPLAFRTFGATELEVPVRFLDADGRPTEPKHQKVFFSVYPSAGEPRRYAYPLFGTDDQPARAFPVHLEGLGTHRIHASVAGLGDSGAVWLGFDWWAFVLLGVGGLLAAAAHALYKKEHRGFWRRLGLCVLAAAFVLMLRLFDALPEGLIDSSHVRMLESGSLTHPLGLVLTGFAAGLLFNVIFAKFIDSTQRRRARQDRTVESEA